MKKMIAFGIIVIVAVVVGVVSFRLSTDALSIIVGAVLGMAAILPTIVLVAFLLKKNQDSLSNQSRQLQQPPVVVVSGGMMPHQFFQPQQQTQNTAVLPPSGQTLPRRFHLMGYEDADRVEFSDEAWMDAK